MIRFIGNMFLYAANAIQEARDRVAAFLFDIMFKDDHLEGRTQPTGRGQHTE